MFSSINNFYKSICILIVSAASFLSCTKDNTDIKPDTGKSAMVQISIRTPNSSTPKSSRSMESDEASVGKIKVIVLEQPSGSSGYTFGYMVEGQHISQDTEDVEVSNFMALLKSSDVPVKLLLIGNYNDAFDTGTFYEGMPLEEVYTALTDSFESGMEGNLPMYGEADLPKINAEQTNVITATMLRAIARVDVYNQVDEQFSGKFKMQTVQIFRANDKLRLIPDKSVMADAAISVTASTVSSEASANITFKKGSSEEVAGLSRLYLPESASPADADRISGATCIVVGGIYGDDSEPSYYRIDFDSGNEGHPFGQVLRNHKYIFNIKEVHGRGWDTPEEAANNQSSAIIAIMQVWDEMTSEMYFSGNDNYLGISSREVTLGYSKGAEQIVYLQSTVGFRIQARDTDGNPVGPVIGSVGESFENEFFKVELIKDPSDKTDVYRLRITSLDENRTDDSFEGYFSVFTDYWTFSMWKCSKRHTSVYIAANSSKYSPLTSLAGDLGTTNGLFSDISGNAMRFLIDSKDNFSPRGTIPVGGMVVVDVLNSFIGATDDQTMYLFEKLIETVDVIHLPAECTPSVKASALIYDWINNDDHRVLILGTDSFTTNANLIDYFDADGEWYEAERVDAIGTAYGEDANQCFFDGPFGTVPERMDMGFVNNGLGYNNGYTWETVTPIMMVTQGGDEAGKMMHGVNFNLGVLYFGESEVATAKGAALSQSVLASGTVNTDFDKLMANIWAWVARRVVEGYTEP